MDVPSTPSIFSEVKCVRFHVTYIQSLRWFVDTTDVLFTYATNFHIKRGTAAYTPIVQGVLTGDDVALHHYSLATIQKLTGSLDGLFVLFRHEKILPLEWLKDPRQLPWMDKLLLSLTTLSRYGSRVPSTPRERYDEISVQVPIGVKLPASCNHMVSPIAKPWPSAAPTAAESSLTAHLIHERTSPVVE